MLNMNRIKQISRLLLLGLMALPMTLSAEETVKAKYIVLEQGDQQTVEFSLSDAPVLSFKDDSLVVACNGDELVVPLQGLTYRFEDKELTGIKSITNATPSSNEGFAFSHGQVSGLSKGGKVSVYTADGVKVIESSADSNGNVDLQLNQLPKGLYIIKTPAKSFKILKR